jgi:NAD(P)-dependent dehydrogenase (short-subunit alcohol dehydrogenase family)
MAPQESFTGRVAMVSGAASGIGRAAAHEFARRGAFVVVADLNDAGGEQTVAQIEQTGGRAEFVHTDFGSEAEIAALVRGIAARHGRLDAAFNNAGVAGEKEPVAKYTRQNWDFVIGINLTGVMFAMRYEAEQMLRQGHGGSIVNTSSVGGLTGPSLLSAYAAAKAGVIGLTRVAANEHAQFGIRVNAIAPGFTPTPLLAKISAGVPGFAEQAMAGTPMRRGADPLEITRAAVWLSSDEASFVTGQVLAVDGGITVGGLSLQDNPLDL